MNVANIREETRERVQDALAPTAAKQFTDARITRNINLAILDVQVELMKYDPTAFLSIDTFDIVADQERYAKPEGFLFEIQLAIADSRFSAGWRPLEQNYFKRTRTRLSGGLVQYGSQGKWFFLSPVPTASVDEGLQLIWVYSL